MTELAPEPAAPTYMQVALNLPLRREQGMCASSKGGRRGPAVRPERDEVGAAAPQGATESLFERIGSIVDRARAATVRAVSIEMVLAYWHIGREILETLQAGEDRAEYGRRLIAGLSRRLTERYGRGFSASNLRYFRQFFQAFSDRKPEIRHMRSGESRRIHQSRIAESRPVRPAAGAVLQDLALAAKGKEGGTGFAAGLGWWHSRVLMAIESRTERRFYEIEAAKDGHQVFASRGEIEREQRLLEARRPKQRRRR